MFILYTAAAKGDDVAATQQMQTDIWEILQVIRYLNISTDKKIYLNRSTQ